MWFVKEWFMAKELCIYCNQRAADTRDHVPPKSVILEPYPPNLPTVPACAQYNHGFGKSTDTDFKLYLALMVAVSHSPSTKLFLASANRTLLKNKAKLEKIKNQVIACSQESNLFLLKIPKKDRKPPSEKQIRHSKLIAKNPSSTSHA